MAEEIEKLRDALTRTRMMLDKVTADNTRLKYELDTIHHKNGTYRIITHLRNDIQRLTISKLVLIQSTAMEIDRLRTIIRSLSKGEDIADISVNTDYSQLHILNDLLPPPTPTSPPPDFSWKETYNYDIDINEAHDTDTNNDEHKLDQEDDIKIPEMNLEIENNIKIPEMNLDIENNIKIPEMNLELEDGAIDPISLIHRQSSDGESENDNGSGDDDNYVIERVASPEASHNIYSDSDSADEHPDNVQIASPEKQPLLPDHIDLMNSEDTTNSDIPDQYDGMDDNMQHNHPPHDASPQLQFAGDGIDLNRIHGVATDAPILEPSTDIQDIYGEEDHKFSIEQKQDTSDDEKVGLDDLDLEQDVLGGTAPRAPEERKNDNILLQDNDEDMEELEEISEMGDDDRDRENENENNINHDRDKENHMIIHIEEQKQMIVPPDIRLPDDVDDDEDDDRSLDDSDIDMDEDIMDRLPIAKTALKYDVSSDQLHRRLSLGRRSDFGAHSPDSDDYDISKPRRPLPPRTTPSSHDRGFSLSAKNVSLLAGLRMGEMDVAIEICAMADLIELMSIICRGLTLLPYGLKEFRNKLAYILQKRMSGSYELTQQFTFFLNSYRDCFAVSRLYKDSVCMDSIVELQPLCTLISRPVTHVRTPSQSRSTTIKDLALLFDIDEDDEKLPESYANPYITDERETLDRIAYSGNNVVEFFRLPLLYPNVDEVFVATECTELICPITGCTNVVQLEIRKIYNSNAKPLLIDCYTDDSDDSVSSFILKYGDDLRRDAAVLMMFKFMNNLWIDNSHRYNNKQIAALTYKCMPMGPDYGIIELIPNCQTLKDITDKYVNGNKRNKLTLSDDVMNNLIATCAGSYMAAYIMGIRDRHYDNVLVTDSGTIFHIDFGYMLGEKVTGIDTSKMAITSDLAKLMGKRWIEFVQISAQCWVILRENHQELLDFAKLAFSFLYPQETVQDFLKETLLLQLSVEQGRDKIQKRLMQAPKKLKTKMKNFVHKVASRQRSGSSARERDRSPSASRRSKTPAPLKHDKSTSPSDTKRNSKINIFSSFLKGDRR